MGKFAAKNKDGIKSILRSLRHKNYKLFFSGQLISLVGTWMQSVAMSWLVYRLTNSALMLGLIAFLSQAPSFFVSPFAGVLIDRWDKHKVMVITQILAMVQAFILAALTLAGSIQVWHLVLLSLTMGLINSFDMPLRQAFVVEIIEDRKDLSNAIALNSSMVNGAKLFGPAIAGILVAIVGEGLCFLINGFWNPIYNKRSAIEAKISEGKRMYGLNKSYYKGYEGDKIWACLGIMALNMRKLIRDITKNPELILRFAG